LKKDPKAGKELDTCENKSFLRSHSSSGNGAESCPFDVRVQISVPQIIDRAPSASHYQGTSEE